MTIRRDDDIRKCTYCKKFGHTASRCGSKKADDLKFAQLRLEKQSALRKEFDIEIRREVIDAKFTFGRAPDDVEKEIRQKFRKLGLDLPPPNLSFSTKRKDPFPIKTPPPPPPPVQILEDDIVMSTSDAPTETLAPEESGTEGDTLAITDPNTDPSPELPTISRVRSTSTGDVQDSLLPVRRLKYSTFLQTLGKVSTRKIREELLKQLDKDEVLVEVYRVNNGLTTSIRGVIRASEEYYRSNIVGRHFLGTSWVAPTFMLERV